MFVHPLILTDAFDFDGRISFQWTHHLERLTGGMDRSEKDQESSGNRGSTWNRQKWRDNFFWNI